MAQPETREYLTNVSQAAKIFSKYGDFIYQIIYSQVNDKIQADDMFQDLFLSIVRKPIPQDVDNTKSYLRTAIKNDIIDAARRRVNSNDNMNKYCIDQKPYINKIIPEKVVAELDETNIIFKFIRVRLTSTQYRAIILRYKNNLSFKEIAAEMDVEEKTVKKHIYRGLCKIRQLMRQKEGINDNHIRP